VCYDIVIFINIGKAQINYVLKIFVLMEIKDINVRCKSKFANEDKKNYKGKV